MLQRPAKRSYTETALELWLERLAPGWEHLFSREALEAARALYRQSQVREIAVFAAEATIHANWDGGTAHAVLEWEDGRLFWRTTLERPVLSEALVAAGIYEMEELLGDELADPGKAGGGNTFRERNPHGRKQEARQAESQDDGKSGTAESGRDTPPSPVENSTAGLGATPASPRELVLGFSESEGGILCRPLWEEKDAENNTSPRNRRPAYGPEGIPGEQLHSEDRAALFRLTTHARKSGFFFEAALAGWRLSSPATVQLFVSRKLSAWERRWRVEGREHILPLGRELPPLTLTAEVDFAPPDNAPEADDTGEFPPGAEAGLRWRWRLQLEGEWLPESVTRRLLTERGGAVLVPGRGVARLDFRQQTVLEEWSGMPEVLPRYGLLSLFSEERVRVSATPELDAWRQALLHEPAPLAATPDFLRPYQARGVAWLAHMLAQGTHPLLADEMGLGKTVQVLALLHLAPLTAPVLIVCPASVVPVWEAETNRFFPGTAVRVLQRGSDFVRDREPKIWLASYNQLRRNKALLAQVEFSHAVLDEAQYIKNPAAKVTEACLAIRAQHRLALTGTPIENHPLDIWTIFRFLMPGLLGRRSAFEAKLGSDAEVVSRLARQVAPFVLRRTKTVVAADLPPKLAVPLLCPMSETQRDVYRGLVEEGVAALGDAAPEALFAGQGMSFLALLTRLRQAACDPGLLPGHETAPVSASGKITLLLERLGEIVENGRKVVVFSQFVSLLNRVEIALRKQFPAVPLFKLTGATTERAVPVAEFQNATGTAIILVSLRAGGTGITLHSAEYVFLLDPWWNPAVEAQAVDRVHRIGQKNATFVYRMISADTIEARVEALKAAKAELFASVVGDIPDMSDWSAHFPSLRALIG